MTITSYSVIGALLGVPRARVNRLETPAAVRMATC
jgi:hypothetical protein